MVEATLAAAILAQSPTLVEQDAIDALVTTYSTYAADAESNSVSITAAGLALGEAAMAAALVGMSAPNAGLTSIPAALSAFWVAVAGGLSTSFPGATVIVPPPHASFASDFQALMPANTSGEVTEQEAADSVAAIMHTGATTGGSVTFPGPVTTPIL